MVAPSDKQEMPDDDIGLSSPDTPRPEQKSAAKTDTSSDGKETVEIPTEAVEREVDQLLERIGNGLDVDISTAVMLETLLGSDWEKQFKEEE